MQYTEWIFHVFFMSWQARRGWAVEQKEILSERVFHVSKLKMEKEV